MSVRSDLVEVVCDGPNDETDCPGNSAWADYGGAANLRKRMKDDGWLTAQRGGIDRCPDCAFMAGEHEAEHHGGPSMPETEDSGTASGRCEVCGEVGDVRRTDDPDPRVPQVICVDLEACASRFPDVVDAEACEQS